MQYQGRGPIIIENPVISGILQIPFSPPHPKFMCPESDFKIHPMNDMYAVKNWLKVEYFYRRLPNTIEKRNQDDNTTY
jgi:hypothetical protein